MRQVVPDGRSHENVGADSNSGGPWRTQEDTSRHAVCGSAPWAGVQIHHVQSISRCRPATAGSRISRVRGSVPDRQVLNDGKGQFPALMAAGSTRLPKTAPPHPVAIVTSLAPSSILISNR